MADSQLKMPKGRAVCVAGGTGGHINAALAIGEELQANLLETEFITGQRPLDYKLFPRDKTAFYPATPLRTKNPFKLMFAGVKNVFVLASLLLRFTLRRPRIVIGTGGYICGPTLLAAKMLGIKVAVVEQNAVMGLTNRLLSKIADYIFLQFEQTKGLSPKMKKKSVVAGNPVRGSISYRPVSKDYPFEVLVFGGSLGASQINTLVLELIRKDFPFPVRIHHQTGNHDLELPKTLGENIEYLPVKYIDNMDRCYHKSHVIISRAGASSVSEINLVKRAAYLIPYPAATDNHQYFNALELQRIAECDVTVWSGRGFERVDSDEVYHFICTQHQKWQGETGRSGARKKSPALPERASTIMMTHLGL